MNLQGREGDTTQYIAITQIFVLSRPSFFKMLLFIHFRWHILRHRLPFIVHLLEVRIFYIYKMYVTTMLLFPKQDYQ